MVNCAAEHLCRVAILSPFQETYLLWRANNFFQDSQNHKTNHDQLRPLRNFITDNQITLHIICINFEVAFSRITSENWQPLTQFMKKYSSYIILLNQGRCIIKKDHIYEGKCSILFCYLFWFRTRLVRVTQHDFL